jgi:hypothetical protein
LQTNLWMNFNRKNRRIFPSFWKYHSCRHHLTLELQSTNLLMLQPIAMWDFQTINTTNGDGRIFESTNLFWHSIPQYPARLHALHWAVRFSLQPLLVQSSFKMHAISILRNKRQQCNSGATSCMCDISTSARRDNARGSWERKADASIGVLWRMHAMTE